MCLHQKNYKHKAAYFTGNQVKFSTPSESLNRQEDDKKRTLKMSPLFVYIQHDILE